MGRRAQFVLRAHITGTLPVIVRASMAAFFAATLLNLACSPGFDATRPDVVLVIVDTLRADHIGAYGYPRDTTPHIDTYARGAVLFENSWSTAPWTLPSIMSIVTGRYPSNHRVENDGLRLAEGNRTLAMEMSVAGYSTAAFVSHVYVTETFGFSRGFETFEDFGLSRPEYRLEAGMEPSAGTVTNAALEWLRRQGSAPVFLMVHYFDPHWPYDPPPQYIAAFPSDYRGPYDASYDSISKFIDPRIPIPDDYREFLIDRYDGEIRYTDEEIGRLMGGLVETGRGERTWVIVTADHGEEFDEHGSMGHGRRLYQESIRVPLLIGRPVSVSTEAEDEETRDAEPVRVDAPVGGIDILPTILDLAGISDPPAGLRGQSLASWVTEGPPPAWSTEGRRALVSETIRLNAYRKAVRLGALKLIRFMDENRQEIYDLETDPAEESDIADSRPDDVRRLLHALFDEVDLLSGGWNLRWSSDGRPRRFQGQLRTEGIFRTMVPLYHDVGTYSIEGGNTLNFSDPVQSSESGLAFTTAPPDSRVSFYLLIDGEPALRRVYLGGNRSRPGEMPMVLGGTPKGDAPFTPPPYRSGGEVGFYLWRNRPATPDQEIVLDDEIRERLRSLGYVD